MSCSKIGFAPSGSRSQPAPLTPVQSQLAAHYFRFALRLARQRIEQFPQYAQALESAATWGLMSAARRFDPSFGVRFSTYAARRIKGEISNTLAIEQKNTPTSSLAAQREAARMDGQRVSPTGFRMEDGQRVGLMGFDGNPVLDHLASSDQFEYLVSHLEPRDAEVLRLIYCDGLSLRQIGRQLDLPHCTVQRIRDRALAELAEVIPPKHAA